MPGSAGQDDTGERMNLPCRREAENHGPGPPAKFVFQIFFHGTSLSAVAVPENVAPAAFISQDNFALQ
jgi:hypothetical protein